MSRKCLLRRPSSILDNEFAPLLFTTDQDLPNSLEEMKSLCSSKYRQLVILVGKSVRELTIDVGSEIKQLCIARTTENEAPAPLLIHDSSTFCDVPLRTCLEEGLKGHDVCLANHVQIKADPATSGVFQQQMNDNGATQKELENHLDQMNESGKGDPKAWKNWKGAIAGVLGLVAGAGAGAGAVYGNVQTSATGFTFSTKIFSLYLVDECQCDLCRGRDRHRRRPCRCGGRLLCGMETFLLMARGRSQNNLVLDLRYVPATGGYGIKVRQREQA